MQLDAEEVRGQIDDLAGQIQRAFASEQTVSGASLIQELEGLRKAMETATPDVIGAYYGFLRVNESFEQIIARNAWAHKRFWPIYLIEMSLLIILLGGGATLDVWSTHNAWLSSLLAHPAITCAWWGAVGATIAALHLLYYNRIHGTLSQTIDAWIATKQIAGGVLGVVASMLLQVTALTTTGSHAVSSGMLPALTAFLAGFSERKFLTYLQTKLGNLLPMAKGSL
ncbi:hypothetical protein [Ferroacidibacillus organovorans]|uniref:Uncharacterized protein n=1 Tax=Ferroacidibacillus organovorans TaxID=1765683 RepID=A0A162U557_9BACL|nr:hypothetical protein [Ferroacidibacillus organovorans]KYP81408.1 hypothetical protein AYJ22_01190 [Ferroacidibacillus organovorans]OAG95195.1 hypothetical protein AYW79_01790 [Ferroacidibacillus organovorans]OPG15187.1 hypothetical protein B2M26_13650 [Ferroacidibacillus organovorans]